MKAKFLLAALLVGASVSSFAQGYKDGIDFYKIGELENAQTIFDNNKATASSSAEAQYYIGQIALANGKLADAKAAFDKGVSVNPNYAYNYVGQGAVALKNGNKSAAGDLFKQASKLSKKDATLEVAIGRAYFQANPTTYAKEIEKQLKQARKYDKNSPEPYILEGDMSVAVEDWGNAMGKYEMAMTCDPTNIESTVKYSDTYYRVNPELALTKLREIIKSQPNSALVQRQLAMKLYDHGDFTEAAETYGNFVKTSANHFPQDEARFSQLLYTKRQYRESLGVAQNLEGSLKPGEDYYVASLRLQLYNLGELHRWDAAVQKGDQLFTAVKGVEKDNLYFKDYVMYATVLDKADQPEKAIEYYNKAIEMSPEDPSLARSLTQQYLKAKKYDQAIDYANKVIATPKHEPNDLHVLATIYTAMMVDTTLAVEVRNDAVKKGIAQEKVAIEADPENITFLSNLAYMQQMLKGGLPDAVVTLDRLANVITGKGANYVTANKQFLSYAYNVMFTYYYKEKNLDKAREIATKWHEQVPDEEMATKYYEALTK